MEVLPRERDAKDFFSPSGGGEVRKSDRSADASGAMSLASFSLPKQAYWAGLKMPSAKTIGQPTGQADAVNRRFCARLSVWKGIIF
ncbi:MAG: hypothetical protein AMXMBFR60_08740 [Chloroflexota bacterium]